MKNRFVAIRGQYGHVSIEDRLYVPPMRLPVGRKPIEKHVTALAYARWICAVLNWHDKAPQIPE